MAHDMREFQQVEAKRAARVSATGSQTGISIVDYIGTLKVVLSASKVSGTTPTLAVKLEESDTVGGTYTDVTGGGFTTLSDASGTETIHVDTRGLKSFIRVTETLGGTSPVFDSSVIVVGRKQKGGQ